MAVFAGYYYAFYIPATEKITFYKEEAIAIDDQIIMAEAKATKLNMMQKELAEIMSGDTQNVKPLPEFDNSRNVMNGLSLTLAKADQYNIKFGDVSEKDGIVRRNVELTFSASSYANVKSILSEIYNGDYRCMMKDLYVHQMDDAWSVSVDITYFEYK